MREPPGLCVPNQRGYEPILSSPRGHCNGLPDADNRLGSSSARIISRDSRWPSHGRSREAVDLVVKRQEPLAGQTEAVLGLQLVVGDVDEDPFLEIEQLDNG